MQLEPMLKIGVRDVVADEVELSGLAVERAMADEQNPNFTVRLFNPFLSVDSTVFRAPVSSGLLVMCTISAALPSNALTKLPPHSANNSVYSSSPPAPVMIITRRSFTSLKIAISAADLAKGNSNRLSNNNLMAASASFAATTR